MLQQSESSVVPSDLKQLRACMVCSLVKTFSDFFDNGCENCRGLHLEGDRERISEITSHQFEGIISLNDPEDSWVAKWQQLPADYVRGCYAVSVNAELPTRIKQELRELNMRVISRNRQE